MTKGIGQIVLAFAPAIVWAGVIFFLSSQEMLPGLSVSFFDFVFKKTAHAFVFGVLFVLFLRGFAKLGKTAHNSWKVSILLCTLYAITDELHQAFVPGRTASIGDIGFDFLGIALAFLKQLGYI